MIYIQISLTTRAKIGNQSAKIKASLPCVIDEQRMIIIGGYYYYYCPHNAGAILNKVPSSGVTDDATTFFSNYF